MLEDGEDEDHSIQLQMGVSFRRYLLEEHMVFENIQKYEIWPIKCTNLHTHIGIYRESAR